MFTQAQKEAMFKMLEEQFPTRIELEKAVAELQRKSIEQAAKRSNKSRIEMTRWVRGMMAARNLPAIKNTDREKDLNYFENLNKEAFSAQQVKDLSTGATPGSYLVPTIQADFIIEQLADFGVMRRAGAQIIPMVGIEKLTIPTQLASPTVAWIGENTSQAASDANLGQVTFDLKTMRSLTPVPMELLATSTPAIDEIINNALAKGFGEAEDAAFFGTTTVSNAPTSIYASIGGFTSLLVGGSANGGNMLYTDITETMRKSRTAKAQGPFVWITSPRTLYTRIAGMLDQNSRPIFDPNQIIQRLMGYPIFDSTFVLENLSNGSGTNQSWMMFTNPKYIMIGEPGVLEIAVSDQFYFDKNQIAIRGVKRQDHQFAPPLGVTILKGIN